MEGSDAASPSPAASGGDAAARQGAAPGSGPSIPGTAFTIYHPDRLPSELLHWFGATFPDAAARLEFPSSLSKAERARWHHAADRVRLHGQSVGVGDGRYLTIGTVPGSSGGGGSDSGRTQLSQEQAEYAKRVYDAAQVRHHPQGCRQYTPLPALAARSHFQPVTLDAAYNRCPPISPRPPSLPRPSSLLRPTPPRTTLQMEGGKHWERSRGEIEALVASGKPLPVDRIALGDMWGRGVGGVGMGWCGGGLGGVGWGGGGEGRGGVREWALVAPAPRCSLCPCQRAVPTRLRTCGHHCPRATSARAVLAHRLLQAAGRRGGAAAEGGAPLGGAGAAG